MGIIQSLICRECKKEYKPQFRYICEECFGPLDVNYIYPNNITKELFESRKEKTYWRYFELLPIRDKNNIVSINSGFTPLQKSTILKMILLILPFLSKIDLLGLLYLGQKKLIYKL